MSWLHDYPAERQERCRTRARRARRVGRLIGVSLSMCFVALLRLEPDFRAGIEQVVAAGVGAVAGQNTPSLARSDAAPRDIVTVSAMPGLSWGRYGAVAILPEAGAELHYATDS